MILINLADPEEFSSYFEDIARYTKAIGHTDDEAHYFPADQKSLADAFSKTLHNISLISFHYDSGFNDQSSRQFENLNAVFWIIGKEERESNPKLQVLKSCKEAAYQVLAKLKKDKEDLKLIGFDLSKVSLAQIDDIHPGWHGYRVSFPVPIAVTSKISYNPDNYSY